MGELAVVVRLINQHQLLLSVNSLILFELRAQIMEALVVSVRVKPTSVEAKLAFSTLPLVL